MDYKYLSLENCNHFATRHRIIPLERIADGKSATFISNGCRNPLNIIIDNNANKLIGKYTQMGGLDEFRITKLIQVSSYNYGPA